MPTCLSQWFRFFGSRRNQSSTKTAHTHGELHHARSALLNCVEDCPDDAVKRLQLKIQIARSHRELWALRSEVYHCVAMRHHQATATERVQSLARHFEGLIDPADLRRKPR